MKRRIFCLYLSLLMMVSLLLQGCSGKENSETKDPGKQDSAVLEGSSEAMGRYMEEQIELPVPVEVLFDLHCEEDGTLRMLFENEPCSLCLYESSDTGKSWNDRKLTTDWLPEDYRVGDACVGPDGTVFACVGKMSDDPMAEKHASGIYRYFMLDTTGEAKELSLKLPTPKEEYPFSAYGLSSPALSADGKLYGMLDLTDEKSRRAGQVFCFEAGSGEKLWDTEVEDTDLELFGNELYVHVSDGDLLKQIDTESGKELKETACDYNFYNLDIKPDKNKVYCADKSGIYATDSQMEVRELLVDGALGSFFSEDYMFNRLVCVSDDVFLLSLAGSTGKKELFRYQYDPDVPTRPDNELTVYTLKDNTTAETLVSDFRRKHPEVYVKYEVGMQGSNAKNVSDAINALNTEIMAGNGPDVLVLNNLPWESYGEKGMLADLSGCYEKDEVFENLFRPYEREGVSCAVPVVFKIPIAAGDRSSVIPIHSAEDLLKVVESTREDYLPFLKGKQSLLRYLFSIYWQTVETEEGSLSREGLRRLLEIIKNIQEHVDASTSEWKDVEFTLDDDRTLDHFQEGSGLETDTMAAMALTYLESTGSLVYMYNHIEKKDLYDDMSWQAISEGTFSPFLMGISQKSQRMEIAEEFLSFCLSEEEQTSFESPEKSISVIGFPVHKNAWKTMIRERSKSELEAQGHAKLIWPPQEVFTDVEKQITGLKTPTMEDPVVIDTILDSVVPYLAGERNLDTVTDEIMQKLELYYAERKEA